MVVSLEHPSERVVIKWKQIHPAGMVLPILSAACKLQRESGELEQVLEAKCSF